MTQQRDSWLVGLGQNIQFVAFWAHFGVAFIAVEHIPWHYTAAWAIILGSAFKEFWIDARYEKDPPQDFIDNLEDWIGWALGACVGALVTAQIMK